MKGIIGFAVRSALVGLALVIIGGIVGRVDLGTMVFRMFAGSVLSAALGAAAFFVIQKYIPELLTELRVTIPGDDLLGGDIAGDLNSGDRKSGERVNILVDDESEDQAETLRREVNQQSGDSQSGTTEPGGTGPLVGYDVATPGDIFTEKENGIVEEVHGDSGNLSDGASPSFEDDVFYSDLKNLPDISGFSAAFHENSFNDGNESSEGEGAAAADSEIEPDFSGSRESKAPADEMDMDPKIYAEAIRTALKKG